MNQGRSAELFSNADPGAGLVIEMTPRTLIDVMIDQEIAGDENRFHTGHAHRKRTDLGPIAEVSFKVS